MFATCGKKSYLELSIGCSLQRAFCLWTSLYGLHHSLCHLLGLVGYEFRTPLIRFKVLLTFFPNEIGRKDEGQ